MVVAVRWHTAIFVLGQLNLQASLADQDGLSLEVLPNAFSIDLRAGAVML
jgi:hypothetical protein